MDTDRWLIRTDGACTIKPPFMGIGAVAYTIGGDGGRVLELSEPAGQGTNNLAEYLAIRRAIEEALKHQVSGVDIECDALVVVKQVNGDLRCRQPQLQSVREDILALASRFPNGFTIKHIYDQFNQEADFLARKASKRKY